MNCLTYVIGRLWAEGGYFMSRRSQLAKLFPRPKWHPVNFVPHFLHRSEGKVITQYQPTEAQKAHHLKVGLWWAWLDLWSFDGQIEGDDPDPLIFKE